MNTRIIRCRYIRRDGNRCPNPAADQAPDAWIVICQHHAAKTLQLIREAREKQAA